MSAKTPSQKQREADAVAKKIYAALVKKRLLVLQDKTFPSVVSSVVGEPIKGSWWSHPMANPIYNGLNAAQRKHAILTVKLLSGKVTFLHESLFIPFFSVVARSRDWQRQGLSQDAEHLLHYIKKNGRIRSDEPGLKADFPSFAADCKTLEKRLLVYTREVHTESGKHVNEISKWSLCPLYVKEKVPYQAACAHLGALVDELNQSSGARLKLPWGRCR